MMPLANANRRAYTEAMRRILMALVAVCSPLACAQPQSTDSSPPNLKGQPEVILAILPLHNNGSDPEMSNTARAISDFLSSEVSDFRGVSLVERRRVSEIMEELSLGVSGAVDQATAIRVGGLLGANVMAFGSLSKLSGKQVVSMRVVKVETGEIIGGVNEFVSDTSELAESSRRIAKKLINAIPSRLKK